MTAQANTPATAAANPAYSASKLRTLRTQLASLRRARRTVRWATAWSALVTGVLWILAALFLLDVAFEMSVPQRVIMLLLSGAGGIALFVWLVRPLLGRGETEIEIALLVERQQGIDSDLVAALQFESPQARDWGSWHLTGAVVDYVGQLGRGLDVFSGFSRAVMLRRAGVMFLTVVVIAALATWRPEYASVFLHRLLLGARHYPTATHIEMVLVNNQVVLREESTPGASRSAEGRPVVFTVLCGGVLPDDDSVREVHIASVGSSRADVAQLELRRLSKQQRVERLQQVGSQLQLALEGQVDFVSPAWVEENAALAQPDAPRTAADLERVGDSILRLKLAQARLRQTIQRFEKENVSTALFEASLAQMVDSLDYTIQLNDAWTDSARVALIAQPVVEMQLTPSPPSYARANDVSAPAGARQISVLQGSDVSVSIRGVTAKGQKKELRDVWLTVLGDTPERIELEQQPGDQAGDSEAWRLPPGPSPLVNIQTEMRFEIQVTDVDGLHLDQPLEGLIRLKADRPPLGAASLVSHVVLPTAKPVVTWQGVTDDYGVAKVRLHVNVFRQGEELLLPPNDLTPSDSAESAATDEGADVESLLKDVPVEQIADDLTGGKIPGDLFSGLKPAEEGEPTSQSPEGNVEAVAPPKSRRTFELLAEPVSAAGLPLAGTFALDLSSFELEKGDSLNVTLEVVDHRGDLPGMSFLGDPLPIEVSDESGVKLAVLEPDERAEQQIDDIKNELLEAGDSP